MFGLTDDHTAVSYALMEANCIQKNISPNAKSATSSKKAMRRALDKLVEYGLVIEKDGFIWSDTLEQTDTDKTGSSCNDRPRQCDTPYRGVSTFVHWQVSRKSTLKCMICKPQDWKTAHRTNRTGRGPLDYAGPGRTGHILIGAFIVLHWGWVLDSFSWRRELSNC